MGRKCLSKEKPEFSAVDELLSIVFDEMVQLLCESLRQGAMHIELDEAIEAGDIGGIKHLLPIITLMMHGGGIKNYALELLRLLYGILHLWTDE
ncbi:hypothetical protein BGZ83_009466 [Gryganskiella cystojenkinii]|nr:hypothetical protein BGZ83_009466 [Gryganskiella cystojenkinii]